MPILHSFPAVLARNGEASALLAVVLGYAVIVFNERFTRYPRSPKPTLRSPIRRATGEVDQDSEPGVRHRFRGVGRGYPVGVRAHKRLELATPDHPIQARTS